MPFRDATNLRGQALHRWAAALVLALLRGYKSFFSPLFSGSCRYQPSCADYMREAVIAYGAARGVWLGLKRLARCHPFGGYGLDPVPIGAARCAASNGVRGTQFAGGEK
jgi:hypothetical protein